MYYQWELYLQYLLSRILVQVCSDSTAYCTVTISPPRAPPALEKYYSSRCFRRKLVSRYGATIMLRSSANANVTMIQFVRCPNMGLIAYAAQRVSDGDIPEWRHDEL